MNTKLNNNSFNEITEQEMQSIDGGVGWQEWVGEAVGGALLGGTIGSFAGIPGAIIGAAGGAGTSIVDNAIKTWG